MPKSVVRSADWMKYYFLHEAEEKLHARWSEASLTVQPGRDGAGSLSVFIGEDDGCEPRGPVLHIDPAGDARYIEVDGKGETTVKPVHLSPEGLNSVQKYIGDQFGRFYLKRTLITARDAGDLWPALKKYDLVNGRGSYEPDGEITNDDLIAAEKRDMGRPEKIEKEIDAIIKKKK